MSLYSSKPNSSADPEYLKVAAKFQRSEAYLATAQGHQSTQLSIFLLKCLLLSFMGLLVAVLVLFDKIDGSAALSSMGAIAASIKFLFSN